MKSKRWFICIVSTILPFLGACTKVSPATPEITPIPATNTLSVPSVKSSPTMMIPTLTPTPTLVTVDIPECIPDGSGGEIFNGEAVRSVLIPMLEWNSFRFSTLYEYLLDDDYSAKELSIRVEGEYSGLRAEPLESYFYAEYAELPTQRFDQSHVVYGDLQTGLQSETIVTPTGLWYRPPGETGWIGFDEGTAARLVQLGEILSPERLIWHLMTTELINPDEIANHMASEPDTINGKAVIHRCWVMPKTNENIGPEYDDKIDGFLFHFEDIATFLTDMQVHLWTTENDGEIIRLAITGFHTGESFYYEGREIPHIWHDTPSRFNLWMDIDKINQPISIKQPSGDAIVVSLPKQVAPQIDLSTYRYNDIPLPEDTRLISDGDSLRMPREFSLPDVPTYCPILNRSFLNHWDEIPPERLQEYTTQASFLQLSDFYLNEMTRRGWALEWNNLEAGLDRLFLFFQRGLVNMPIILTSLPDNTIRISLCLPPVEDVLARTLNRWTFCNETDDPMLGEGVTAIAFDSRKQAWIGTSTGIVMFNGSTWKSFSAQEIGVRSPENLKIWTIAVDQTDTVLVGTNEGISQYDGSSWSTYTKDSLGNPLGSVNALVITPSGEIWAGLNEGKIGLFDGVSWEIYSKENNGPATSQDINAITIDLSGSVWVGTEGEWVFVQEGDKWRAVFKGYSEYRFIQSPQRGMLFDHSGWLWLASEGNLHVFDGTTWYNYNEQSSDLPFTIIDHVIEDQYNRIWIASPYSGLAMLEGDGQWTDYSPPYPSEGTRDTYEMISDPSGKIWIGNNSGLAVFAPPPANLTIRRYPLPTPQPSVPNEPLPKPQSGWTSYAIQGEPFDEMINSIAVDQQNRIWLAGQGAVVIEADSKWTQYALANTPVSGLLSDDINEITVDRLGRVWMATDAGLVVLDNTGGWSNYTPDNSDMPCEVVTDIEIDSEGRIWVGSQCNENNGQVMIEFMNMIEVDGRWLSYSVDPISFITAIEADHQGRIWVGFFDGIAVLLPDRNWDVSSTNDQLDLTVGYGGHMKTLFVDDQDRMWMGTWKDGVIVQSEDGTTVRYSLSEMGLDGGAISSILIDDMGRAWIGSGVGLSVLNTDGTWTSFTPDNSALPSAEITALAIDNLGRVWVGTREGLAVYVWPSP